MLDFRLAYVWKIHCQLQLEFEVRDTFFAPEEATEAYIEKGISDRHSCSTVQLSSADAGFLEHFQITLHCTLRESAGFL